MICAIDFETTGLLLPSAAPLNKQPHIVQIAAVKCDCNLDVINLFTSLIKPPIHIPIEVTKIHGITDEMVKGMPSFRDILPSFCDFMEDGTWLGQNAPFDQGCFWHEGRRLNLAVPFYDAIRNGQTLDLMDLIIAKWGKRRKLGDVYFDLFGNKLANAHDALADITATVACYKALRAELCK